MVVTVVMVAIVVMGSTRYDGWRKWQGTGVVIDGIWWKGTNGGGRMGEFRFSIPLLDSYSGYVFLQIMLSIPLIALC